MNVDIFFHILTDMDNIMPMDFANPRFHCQSKTKNVKICAWRGMLEKKKTNKKNNSSMIKVNHFSQLPNAQCCRTVTAQHSDLILKRHAFLKFDCTYMRSMLMSATQTKCDIIIMKVH